MTKLLSLYGCVPPVYVRPADRALLYHDEDLSSFGPDVFNVDLEAYPLTAFAGTQAEGSIDQLISQRVAAYVSGICEYEWRC